MKFIRPCYLVGIEHTRFAGSVVASFPMTPHHKLLRLLAIHQFGAFDKTATPQVAVGHSVFNDFSFELPGLEVFRGIHVDIRVP